MTGAAALAVALSAHGVQAAPAGLAAALSNAALAESVLATTAAVTATKTIAMTTLQKSMIGATLAVAVGTGVYEARQASLSRSQVEILQQQQAPLVERVEQLARERDTAISKLAALESDHERLRRDTAELPRLRGEVARLRLVEKQSGQVNASAAGGEDAFTQTVLDLTRRAGELNQQLERMPDKRIPELQFLTESDWLSVAKDASLQSEPEVRQALAKLRNVAKGKFGDYVTGALDKFIAATNGQLPADLSELKPYFEVPVEDAVLERWEAVRHSDGSSPQDNWELREKAPADPDFEKPLQVRGWGGNGG
jgi:hypothetical protein